MKKKVEKTRNHGTMTESAFWGMIRSSLRQKSRWWKPIQECKQKAKREYKGVNKRQKFEYKCNVCNKYFPEKEIQVDHIIPVGTLKCGKDLEIFVEKLFCELDNLQCICTSCHLIKSNNERINKK